MTTLAIDAMSGDLGLVATLPAAKAVLQQYPDVTLLLVGRQGEIENGLKQHDLSSGVNLQIRHAQEVVGMQDSPLFALRKKKNSSMRLAIDLVKTGEADACVSSGNTATLLATARFVLKTIPGIKRPAICAPLPRLQGHTRMLDLGANIDTQANILFQFGVMGALLIQCLEGRMRPSVGLLNIGTEDLKGNDTIKDAAKLFRQSDLNYVGFVEANEIYLGQVDLIVCDGFVGNVALKTSEGVVQMVMQFMQQEFNKNPLRKGVGLLAQPVLHSIRSRFDHRKYNGASLLGLKGTVVKSHGSADALGFRHAIEVAIDESRSELVSKIEAALSVAFERECPAS